MYVESNRRTGNGNPERTPVYYESPSAGATFRPSRGETGPRLRVARLRTWPPVATKFQRNSTFEHAPTTEYSGNHTSAVQSRVCSPDVVPVEIFDRAFLLLTGAALGIRRNRRFHCLEQQTYAHASFPVYRSQCITIRVKVSRSSGMHTEQVQNIFTFILMVKDLDAIKRNW